MTKEEKLELHTKILEENNINVTGLSKSLLKLFIIDLAVEEYKNANKAGRTIKSISNKYGINPKTLAKYLKLANIEISGSLGKPFKYDIFHSIDTEEKAYWLGFLYADGYITSKGYSVGLSLSVNDMDHMRKFVKFLDYPGGCSVYNTHQFGDKDNKYSKDGRLLQMVSTTITNKDLWTDLYDKGCVPNKSLILKFPDKSIFKTEDLILHFIRGYFDGDGTLGLYQHSKTNKNLEESLLIVGTKPFLEEVLKYLGEGFLMLKPNCNKLTYRLGYSTKKAYKAAKLMYDNATIYLDRKYEIYLLFASKNRAKSVNPETGIPR